jgi:hypothetical protein
LSNIVQFPVEKSRGDFFAVDAKIWDKLCREGGLNMPIAYLVMARGTGHDNRTTSWSTNAIEQRTGISRPQAKLAVQKLVGGGYVRVDQAGTRPRYTLLPPKGKASEPDFIWLPNTLIDGADGEVPPVELLRQSASLPGLQLFVELYHAQSLAYVGGVHWRLIRSAYDRHRVGQRGQYVVWGFQHKTDEVWHKAAPFVVGKPVGQFRGDGDDKRLVLWDALHVLKATGLAEYVGHVIDADTDDASVVHPYALGETGELEERVISLEAHRAGQALLTDGQRAWVEEHGLRLLPAEQHRTNIQLVGLLRLKYRARTAATATWYDTEKWKEWAATYQRLQHEETDTYAAL